MRKIIAIVICMLLIAALATTGLAAGNATMTVKASKTTAGLGDEIVFTVSISEVDSLRSAGFALKYDTNAFEMVAGSGECTVSNKQNYRFEYNANAGAYVAFFSFGEAQSYSGSIFKFTLKVKDNATMTKYPVSINNLLAKDGSGGDLTCVAVDATVKVGCKTHAWGDGTVTKEATCSEKGTKNYTCSVCGDTKTENIDKIAHTYTNNCDTQCDVCDATRTITHKWDDGKVITKPTCTDKGEELYTCKVCKETKTETLAKTGHSYDNDCDTSCNTCGATRDTEHDYMDRWTFDETGHWHACSNCGDILELTSHTWQQGSTDTEAGKITYTCTVCGASKVEDIPVVPSEPSEPTGPSDPSTGATEDPTPGTTDSTPGTDPQDPTGGDSEDPTEPSQGPDEKEKIHIPWWIIAAAVAVLAVFCGIFLVIGVAIGSRQQGKYSR